MTLVVDGLSAQVMDLGYHGPKMARIAGTTSPHVRDLGHHGLKMALIVSVVALASGGSGPS